MKLLLVGPFGGKNLGDDLILYEFCKFLHSYHEFEISYTSYQDMSVLPGVSTVPILNIRQLKLQCVFAIRHFDLVIFCGGQQVQEPRIKNPIWGHLANMFWISIFAKFFGKDIYLLCVGCQYPLSPLGRIMFTVISQLAEQIIIRDPGSLKYLYTITNSSQNKRFQLSSDLVICSALSNSLGNCVSLSYRSNGPLSISIFISKQSFSRGKALFCQQLKKILDFYLQTSSVVNITYTDIQAGSDERYAQVVYDFVLSNCSCCVSFVKLQSVVEFDKLVKKSNLVISTRLHPIVCAIVNEKAFFALNPEKKTVSLLESLGLGNVSFSSDDKLDFRPNFDLTILPNSAQSFDLNIFISKL